MIMANAEEWKTLAEDITEFKVMKFFELMKSDVIIAMAEGKNQCGLNEESEKYLQIKSEKNIGSGLGWNRDKVIFDDTFVNKIKSAGFYFQVASARDHNDYVVAWREIETGEELFRDNGAVMVNLAWN